MRWGVVAENLSVAGDERAGLDTARLQVSGLTKGYKLGQSTLAVLRGLSLHVGRGEIVAIMGPSGSGKTTLLNCIAGIDLPDGGAVELSGEPVDYADEAALTLLRRHRIGMVFQFFNLIPTLTVRENVALPLMIAGSSGGDADGRVEALLAEVGLQDRAAHHPFQLSGGEMQLVSIARALVHGPDMLLADEPTGNVNPAIGRSIMEALRASTKRHGTGVLMVTHSPEHAAWGDRICFLKDGEIAAERHQAGRRDEVAPIYDQLLALGI